MTRFSLRDVFWLTLVVAMGVAWWVDHARAKREHLRHLQTESQYAQAKSNIFGLTLVLEREGYTVEEPSWGGIIIKSAKDANPQSPSQIADATLEADPSRSE